MVEETIYEARLTVEDQSGDIEKQFFYVTSQSSHGVV